MEQDLPKLQLNFSLLNCCIEHAFFTLEQVLLEHQGDPGLPDVVDLLLLDDQVLHFGGLRNEPAQRS